MLTKKKLEVLERFGEKSADNLIKAIKNSQKTSFPRFVYGLGIRNVGEHIARLFEKYFNEDIEKFSNASLEELEAIEGVGPIVAKEVTQFWSNLENMKLVKECLQLGVSIEKNSETQVNILNDQRFVFTGSLEKMSRKEAQEKVVQLGCLLYTSPRQRDLSTSALPS